VFGWECNIRNHSNRGWTHNVKEVMVFLLYINLFPLFINKLSWRVAVFWNIGHRHFHIWWSL
jgi:hypothetical protein